MNHHILKKENENNEKRPEKRQKKKGEGGIKVGIKLENNNKRTETVVGVEVKESMKARKVHSIETEPRIDSIIPDLLMLVYIL